ncbi:MAG: response regulator [Gammaproteobacteria bacterium]|jgi:two-component system chemotaxis response regulator CheY
MAPMLQNDTALIVDRVADVRQYITSVLRRQLGCRRILQAANHPEAQAILDSGTELINWIFYDWDLPSTDPQPFLNVLRQRPGCRDANILITTRSQQKVVLEDALRAGGTDYLIKPFTSSILLFKVRRISLSRERRSHDRLQVHPSQEIAIRFQRGTSTAGTMVSISHTGCLTRAPCAIGESARIYETASMRFQTADGMMDVEAELRRIEADCGPEPCHQYILLAFHLRPLQDVDQKRLERFIAALGSSPLSTKAPGVEG